MKIVTGELFDSGADLIIVTGNAYLKGDSSVAMGRGAAKQLRDQEPGIDLVFGELIRFKPAPYGLVLSGMYGLFQVKNHFKDDADLKLIQNSVAMLTEYAYLNPGMTIAMNMPGTGFGRLPYNLVLPIIQELPDNVRIYQKGDISNVNLKASI